MDELIEWLYSDDEGLYNKSILERKSKDMKNLGDQIYKRYNDWNALNEKYSKIESIVNDTIIYISNMEKDLKKGKKTNLDNEDIAKIREIIQDTFTKISEKKNLSDKKELTKLPPVFPDEIDMIINTFNDNVNKIQNEAKEKREKEKME